MYIRQEYKYLVSNELLDDIRAMMFPYVRLDHYLSKRDSIDYTVRSIYFDTCKLNFYQEKLFGLKLRKKFRLRGYDRPVKNQIVFLEVKQKDETFISKNRSPIYFKNVRNLLISGDINKYILNGNKFPKSKEDARRFLYYFYGKSLVPVVLIVYNREAYHSKFNSGVRITFDKSLRSEVCSSTNDLFSRNKSIYSLTDYFIMEIKFIYGYPLWLKSIIEKLELQRCTISKYAICIDKHKNELSRFFKRSSTELFDAFYKQKIIKEVLV